MAGPPSTLIVVLLGATARLAPEVTGGLLHHGFGVAQVARRPSPGVDVGGVDTRHALWWRPDVWAALVAGHDVAAIINLVAGRDRRTASAATVGVGAIRTMAAIRDAARAQGGYPLTVHVGSVAEAHLGSDSAYATAKRASRTEALRMGVSVIVTLAVVPRATGDPHDRMLRAAASLVPALAAVPIAISPAREVGDALAGLVAGLWHGTDERPGTTQLVLAARLRPLGEVVGAVPRHRWYSSLITAGAGRLPATGVSRLDRLAGLTRLAQQAEPTTPTHYLAAVLDDDAVPLGGTCDGLRLSRRHRADRLGDHWLLPPAKNSEDAGDG